MQLIQRDKENKKVMSLKDLLDKPNESKVDYQEIETRLKIITLGKGGVVWVITEAGIIRIN